MKLRSILLQIVSLLLCLYSISGFAQPTIVADQSPVQERAKKESHIPSNYFAIALYKPTYILPYYYTASPDYLVYQNNTPGNQRVKSSEFKYQFSLKVPVWKNIFNYPSSLYLAYTQLSYWQLYRNDPFFRESDYEPELFLANNVKWHLFGNWKLDFINPGLDHQSNGYGNTLERSWNRMYVDAIMSTDHWMISLKPWYVLSTNENNNNIAKYLGYGRLLVAYKIKQHIFSIETHNIIEHHARRATATLTWSFPITPYIKGYAQIFSGYGQSLIEYDNRTNSIGIGLALNDWI